MSRIAICSWFFREDLVRQNRTYYSKSSDGEEKFSLGTDNEFLLLFIKKKSKYFYEFLFFTASYISREVNDSVLDYRFS